MSARRGRRRNAATAPSPASPLAPSSPVKNVSDLAALRACLDSRIESLRADADKIQAACGKELESTRQKLRKRVEAEQEEAAKRADAANRAWKIFATEYEEDLLDIENTYKELAAKFQPTKAPCSEVVKSAEDQIESLRRKYMNLHDLIMEALPEDALAEEEESHSDDGVPILFQGWRSTPNFVTNSSSRPLIRFVDGVDLDSGSQDAAAAAAPPYLADIALDHASFSAIAAEFEQNLQEADRHRGARVSPDDRREIPNHCLSGADREDMRPKMGSSDRWVVMNVGGIRWTTTVETLCMDSGSMLAAWVLRYRSDEEEELRIDRDGSRFAHVLNYLREGTLWLEDLPSLRGIYEEAKFYQLKGLKALCEERMLEVEAKHAAESKRRKEEIEEALKGAFFRWERDRAYHFPKGKNDVLAILRGRRLGISEPPRFDMNEDF
ncbi:hypothetical protein SELMODRAFT_440079 [Selaginella moellendorffii]|uniref:BTB domain-containing protein n=2 Tax=Selaginella moellendorffii TaxID=88036 RepID=D8R9Z3_SELML|nr:hypothetical protein SELMODRAFT_440079 [Selaginella moellendorffii]